MTYLGYALVTLIGYLLGSIPTGYVLGRMYGVDVLKHGSGKTGGTNLARLVGWPRTIPVAIGDPAKAMLAILIARAITHSEVGAVLAAFAAVLGHNWSIYLGFKGGRGIGPIVGALIVFDPLLAAIAVITGFLVAVLSRYVSLGSITGCVIAIAGSIIMFGMGREIFQHTAFIVVTSGLIILQHSGNIQRLIAGSERKLGERVPMSPESTGNVRVPK
jgi:glycerol-3-phosphate acyltransferase PlsY